MLYYRTKRSSGTKTNFFNFCISVFILVIWSFWFLSEIPIQKVLLRYGQTGSAVISKGNMTVSTPLSSDDETATDFFTEPAVGVLTSSYGERWGRMHEGIDIGGTHGSEIMAADAGTVLLAQWVEGYGNYIELDHGNGFKTAYGHCDRLLVSCGDSVTKGQAIATMGNTGNSTGTHLHFEVLLHGEPQNPLDYVIY